MELKLLNVGYKPMCVEYNKYCILVNPKESFSFEVDNTFKFKLKHLPSDSNSSFLYVLSALLSYEQSRVKINVNGEYCFHPKENDTLLKVKTYNYIVDKNYSYNSFIFNSSDNSLETLRYFAPEKERILKKFRFLYLLGGKKSLFPICIILFLFSFLCFMFEPGSIENILFTLVSGVLSFLLGKSYIESLHILREALEDVKIHEYMNSQRKEFRTLEDEMIQKYYDTNAEDECYW